jgi:hypothetical protein
MPKSAPLDKSPRSAFSPAVRGFGRFLAKRPFIISRVVLITFFPFMPRPSTRALRRFGKPLSMPISRNS